jgi:predicted permease
MQAILAVTIPFFALVLCGYLAARAHVLPQAAIPGLNGFVLYFALPCLLFRFGVRTPVVELLNPAVLGVYLAAGLMIVAFTVAVTRGPQVQLKDAAFGALAAVYPNTGFMGVPLLVALQGPAAAGPVICIVLADLFVTSSICIGLAQGHDAAHHGARGAVLQALRGALSNPLPWSIALGVLFSIAGLKLVGPLATIVAMFADAASPVALFTIGAVVWRAGQQAVRRTPWREFAPLALLKLFAHPLLVLALATSARALGAQLSGLQITVLTLAAALPTAANVSLFAERYGADSGRVARVILTSTALAFASFTGWAWLMGARPA